MLFIPLYCTTVLVVHSSVLQSAFLLCRTVRSVTSLLAYRRYRRSWLVFMVLCRERGILSPKKWASFVSTSRELASYFAVLLLLCCHLSFFSVIISPPRRLRGHTASIQFFKKNAWQSEGHQCWTAVVRVVFSCSNDPAFRPKVLASFYELVLYRIIVLEKKEVRVARKLARVVAEGVASY
jgi:hypothetical protein